MPNNTFTQLLGQLQLFHLICNLVVFKLQPHTAVFHLKKVEFQYVMFVCPLLFVIIYLCVCVCVTLRFVRSFHSLNIFSFLHNNSMRCPANPISFCCVECLCAKSQQRKKNAFTNIFFLWQNFRRWHFGVC